MQTPLVIFDLDGTLVDTAPDLLTSVNHCLGSSGLEEVTRADLSHLVGQGGRAMLQRAFTKRGRILSEEELDGQVALFLDRYATGMPGMSQPFEGVLAAMDALEAAGYGFALCTNKTESLSCRLIEALGLSHRFAAICGGDTFPTRKPDAAHLIGTIERAGGSPEQAVMVGDSQADIGAAQAAGIPVVAVDFGYTDSPVETYAPDAVISHYRELTPQLVDRLIAAQADEAPSLQHA